MSTVTPYQSTTPGSCPRPARLSASATTRGASTVGQGSTKGTTWTARRRAPAGAWEATKRRSYEVREDAFGAWRALHPPHELVHLLTACSPSSASPGSAPALRSSPARGGGRGGDGGLSGTAEREREREREREKVCALAHVHSVLEVEVPVGQGDEANGTHAQYLRRSEAHDQVHATTPQPRAPARVALEILAAAGPSGDPAGVCEKNCEKKRDEDVSGGVGGDSRWPWGTRQRMRCGRTLWRIRAGKQQRINRRRRRLVGW